MDATKTLLNSLREELERNKFPILLVGVVGSIQPSEIHGDIDIFAILGNETEAPQELSMRHSQLVLTIENVQKQMVNQGISVAVFTEFRMEEISRYLLNTHPDPSSLLLHLKVYPTLSSIIFWQTRVIARGYFENIGEILYKTATGEESLRKFLSSIPLVSSKEILEFLRSLAYETYEYLCLSTMPQNFLKHEGMNKLSYIVKFLAIDLLNHTDYYSKVKRMTWIDLYSKIQNLTAPEFISLKTMVSYVNKNINAHRNSISFDELRTRLQEICSIIDNLCHRIDSPPS